MTIIVNNGKPDIFLTMTCNPSWSEISSELQNQQTPQDRPDLLTQIFQAKFEQLKEDVVNKGVLEKVISYMYVTEFQKRGLSHIHMLLILDNMISYVIHKIMITLSGQKYQIRKKNHNCMKLCWNTWYMVLAELSILDHHVWRDFPKISWKKHNKVMIHILNTKDILMNQFQ